MLKATMIHYACPNCGGVTTGVNTPPKECTHCHTLFVTEEDVLAADEAEELNVPDDEELIMSMVDALVLSRAVFNGLINSGLEDMDDNLFSDVMTAQLYINKAINNYNSTCDDGEEEL